MTQWRAAQHQNRMPLVARRLRKYYVIEQDIQEQLVDPRRATTWKIKEIRMSDLQVRLFSVCQRVGDIGYLICFSKSLSTFS